VCVRVSVCACVCVRVCVHVCVCTVMYIMLCAFCITNSLHNNELRPLMVKT